MSEHSDKELLDLFHNGENPHYAFKLLVKKYQQKLYYVIRRIVIDHDDTHDVLQNTFVKVYQGLAKYKEEAQLYTWLYRIACNESLNFIKQNKTRLHQNLDQHFPHPLIESGEKLDSDEGFIQRKLQEAILTLPEKQRLVFTLKYYDEMTYEEMSKVVGTSIGALKASYFHATKKIEEFLVEALNHIKL